MFWNPFTKTEPKCCDKCRIEIDENTKYYDSKICIDCIYKLREEKEREDAKKVYRYLKENPDIMMKYLALFLSKNKDPDDFINNWLIQYEECFKQ